MRTTPLPFVATGAAIDPYLFVNVDVAAGTAAIATTAGTSDGIAIGHTQAAVGEPITVMSVKDTSSEVYVRAGGVIAKGDLVCASAGGMAITDLVNGKMIAREAGVLGQLITVLSKEAY